MKIIEFQNVKLGYGKDVIFDSLNFSISQGEFLGIVGPNGAGKSTILKSILGILKPLSGSVKLNNHNNTDLRFGYVPQRQVMDETYPLSVLDVVLMGRYGLLGPFKKPKAHDIEKSMEALEHVGMQHIASNPYRALSGGQKQRVLIARALVSDPTVLVLDEPTTDMDVAAEKSLMDLVRHLHLDHALTVILVSHTISVVANYAEKIAFVGDCAFQIDEINNALTTENLSRLYASCIEVVQVDGRHVIV